MRVDKISTKNIKVNILFEENKKIIQNKKLKHVIV
jgi:hypothetical protein